MPTLDPIVNTAKYLRAFDANGVGQSLFQPTNRSIAVWDGTNVTWASGGNADPIILPNLEVVEGGSHPHLIIRRPSGQLMAFTTPAASTGKFRLISDGGQIEFEEVGSDNAEFPTAGIGLVGRDVNGNSIVVGGADAKGIYYIDGAGVVRLIGNGSDGQVLKIVNNAPLFGEPASGSAVGGFPGSGLRSVLANNTSVSNINILAPTLAFKSSVDGSITTIDNINVNVSTSAAAGTGGIDTGAVTPSTWYYIWAVNDGATTAAMLSLSAVTPDLTNAAAFTLSAFVGMVYIEGTGDIRPFIQKGVRFWTPQIEWGTNLNISSAYAAIVGAVNLTTLVPPNATSFSGLAGGSSAETLQRIVAVAATATGIGEQFTSTGNMGAGNSLLGFKWDYGQFLDVPILAPSAPVLYWKAQSAITGKRRICVNGYQIRG